LNIVPPPTARFYFLKEGDRYDLAKREVIELETMGSGDEDW
jgi:hypothetical protein